LCIPGGEALNLKFPAINGESEVERLAQAIEAYCRLGGLQVQFNILSYETLLDAKDHPDRYPDLLVRVSGYSAYFRDLTETMKEEIITRTEYDLHSGVAVPFVERHLPVLVIEDRPRPIG
jgi:pyruvate-formate lyase